MGGLWHAWHEWHAGPHGDLVLHFMFWTGPLWWWARWGKILEWVAGLAILVDIVGPDRIEAFAETLPSKYDRAFLPFARLYVAWMGKRSKQDSGPREVSRWRIAGQCVLLALTVAGGLYGVFAGWSGTPNLGVLGRLGHSLWSGVTGAFAGFVAGITLGVAVAFYFSMILTVVAIVGALLQWLLYRVSRFLRRQDLRRFSQIASLACLVIGFHFDMLAS